MDTLAADIGCLPPPAGKLSTWFNDPMLAWYLAFGAVTPSHYALQGPDVSQEVAKQSRNLIINSKL